MKFDVHNNQFKYHQFYCARNSHVMKFVHHFIGTMKKHKTREFNEEKWVKRKKKLLWLKMIIKSSKVYERKELFLKNRPENWAEHDFLLRHWRFYDMKRWVFGLMTLPLNFIMAIIKSLWKLLIYICLIMNQSYLLPWN